MGRVQTRLEPETNAVVAGEKRRARAHAVAPGSPCANCATPLQGPWCHACGQKGEDFHRSIRHLIGEAFEGLTHFDGRFWNTLPRLVRDPGGLTRDYVAGRRASQIPPFRLFLVMLLILFFSAGLAFRSSHVNMGLKQAPPAEAAKARAALSHELSIDRRHPQATAWLRERVLEAAENPEGLLSAMEHHAHMAAVLLLPCAALLLGGLFASRRGVYLFDHLIFSMHSLSFQGLLLSAVYLLGLVGGWAGWLILAAPVHLFAHMRGAYGGGTAITLARMALLFLGSCVVFALLAAGLLVVGLAEAH